MDKGKLSIKNKTFDLVCVAVIVVIICAFAAALAVNGISGTDSLSTENEEITHTDNEALNQSQSSTKQTADRTKWNLLLVNQWNPLPENYSPEIKYLDNGHGIDERAYDDLQDMMNECRAQGLEPVICSSYRTMEKQKELYNNKINQYLTYGYSQEDAKKKAGELVAVPGTSEHQLGLALDIVDISYQTLDERQENTAVQKWLLKNSWRYGFILRYPTDKSEITGISYEPWHYRYVGREDAEKIYEAGVCLEEYLNS